MQNKFVIESHRHFFIDEKNLQKFSYQRAYICLVILHDNFFFFSIWVFFHEHSRFTGQQGKGEGIFLTPLYHFHPLHRHLDISRAITAGSSPLHIANFFFSKSIFGSAIG